MVGWEQGKFRGSGRAALGQGREPVQAESGGVGSKQGRPHGAAVVCGGHGHGAWPWQWLEVSMSRAQGRRVDLGHI